MVEPRICKLYSQLGVSNKWHAWTAEHLNHNGMDGAVAKSIEHGVIQSTNRHWLGVLKTKGSHNKCVRKVGPQNHEHSPVVDMANINCINHPNGRF